MQTLACKCKTASKQSSTFKFFKDLPPELRNEIWVFSLPGPRIIGLQKYRQPIIRPAQYNGTGASLIHESCHMTSTDQTNNQESIVVYRSQARVPTIYSVCWESRTVVEQFYSKAFGTSNSPGIWIDFKKDALYLAREIYENGSSFYDTFRQDVHQVKSLAISGIWSPHPEEDPNPLYRLGCVIDITTVIQEFGNLEMLMLVNAQHELGRTAKLGMVPGESAEEYEKWLRGWAHPAYYTERGLYSWPWLEFGTLIDNNLDGSGRWQDNGTRGKIHAWKKTLRSRLYIPLIARLFTR